MQEENCIFCQIASGAMKADIVFKDDLVSVFRDINPVAPSHLLIIPNAHIESNNDLGPDQAAFAARMLTAVPELAEKEGIRDSGYRLIMNTGSDGRQEVKHIHLHLIGGKRMQHPLG
jgi:histidine triad (HIT) family protein